MRSCISVILVPAQDTSEFAYHVTELRAGNIGFDSNSIRPAPRIACESQSSARTCWDPCSSLRKSPLTTPTNECRSHHSNCWRYRNACVLLCLCRCVCLCLILEHKRAVRKGVQPRSNLSAWPCDNCSRVCSSRIGLHAHQQTHR